MCTAIHFSGKHPFLTRTLDYETGFGERVIVTPRRVPFTRGMPRRLNEHYAIIGMGVEAEGIPLYFDAFNEAGLCGAALRFADSCVYAADRPEGGVASFALLPWVLGQCAAVDELLALLAGLTVTDEAFGPALPPAPLHWIFADADRAVIVESTRHGVSVAETTAGVLTNDPPYPDQLANLAAHAHLSPDSSNGAVGLPGDWSSPARFVRAAFLRRFAEPPERAEQALALTAAVAVPPGCHRLPDGKSRFTRYTACLAPADGIYYHIRHGSLTLQAVDLRGVDGDADSLI